jgi:hypothetical protein
MLRQGHVVNGLVEMDAEEEGVWVDQLVTCWVLDDGVAVVGEELLV